MNKYNCYINDYEDKSNDLSKKKASSSLLLQKNNSHAFVNVHVHGHGIEDKKKEIEVNNYNANSNDGNSSSSSMSKHQSNNYVKISNLIPYAAKIPSSSRTQNVKFANTINKMKMINNYNNNNGSIGTNRTLLNLRSGSKFNN